jgi:hypothetical protein
MSASNILFSFTIGCAVVPIDDRIFRWMTEAAGSKIRTVPVSFPDLLKTAAVLRHEHRYAAGGAPPRNWDGLSAAA